MWQPPLWEKEIHSGFVSQVAYCKNTVLFLLLCNQLPPTRWLKQQLFSHNVCGSGVELGPLQGCSPCVGHGSNFKAWLGGGAAFRPMKLLVVFSYFQAIRLRASVYCDCQPEATLSSLSYGPLQHGSLLLHIQQRKKLPCKMGITILCITTAQVAPFTWPYSNG